MSNPSRFAHRAPVVIFSLIGMIIASYLGLFQLHVLSSVWDPIFGEGSVRVLQSPLSQSLPVPDSMLGALGYLSEAIVCLIGGERRFETLPWTVFIYTMTALGMGTISIALLSYQALILHQFCTLCLLSGLISIGLITPGVQEGRLALSKILHPRSFRAPIFK
jgi:uncharacterized membrane protein